MYTLSRPGYFAVTAKTIVVLWNWDDGIKLQILTDVTADSVDSSSWPAGVSQGRH